ncbi:MAG: septum site-determining protein MinC [Burkholderiales bacterium]|nr:septum site-determining protein MinC [Burkholderiales bacterium]
MQNSLTRKPIEVKISTVVAVAVILHESSLASLETALKEMTGDTPDFFDDELAMIDVEPIADHAAPAPTPAPQVIQEHIPAMIVDTPVRAGQRIYARGCDLIITAAVNNGAEVIADGSIHIYAPLRGRALAGARGNTNARIFATAMEAELVSIAGIYRTFDAGFPQLTPHQPVQIKLKGDSIEVTSLKSN